MKPRPRLSLLLTVLILLLLPACDREADLVQLASEKEAIRVMTVLEAEGIDVIKTQVKLQRATVWQLSVAEGDEQRARQLLVEYNLPAETYGGFDAMLESTGMIKDKVDHRARMMRAIGEELATTFEMHDRIVRARVHVGLPEDPTLTLNSAEPSVPTASVFLKYLPSQELNDSQIAVDAGMPIDVETVQAMVARAVDGLSADQVEVVYTHAEHVGDLLATAATGGEGEADAPSGVDVRDASGRRSAAISLDKEWVWIVLATAGGLVSMILAILWWFTRRQLTGQKLAYARAGFGGQG